MNRKDIVKCEVNSPDYPTQAEYYQRAVDQCAESYLSKLSGNAALENITDRVESRIVGVANKVCTPR